MDIRENIAKVQMQIREAAKAAGRDASDITLVAVTKTKPVGMILEAAAAGMNDLGENRVQELVEKYDQLPPEVRWHLIGHLQKNKVKYIIDKTELIHSVDSLELAVEIEKRAAVIQKVQKVLLQVNISAEESKFGIRPGETAELCEQISRLEHIKIMGLMTISVKDIGQAGNRKIFASLRKLAEEISAMKIPGVEMKELSMGMTHDFAEAIAEGATIIRVGTGIFGARG